MVKKMEINDSNKDSVNILLKGLNWWMEETYNPVTGEIESTGEAQAAIQNYLRKLDSLEVKYYLENGKYILVKEK